MEDDTDDIFDAYGEKFSDLINHMVVNPLLNKKDVGIFLNSVGSELFKIGTALRTKCNPNDIKKHQIMLVSPVCLDEAREAMKVIQNKQLSLALNKKMATAKTDDERQKIQATFNKIIAIADFNFSEV